MNYNVGPGRHEFCQGFHWKAKHIDKYIWLDVRGIIFVLSFLKCHFTCQWWLITQNTIKIKLFTIVFCFSAWNFRTLTKSSFGAKGTLEAMTSREKLKNWKIQTRFKDKVLKCTWLLNIVFFHRIHKGMPILEYKFKFLFANSLELCVRTNPYIQSGGSWPWEWVTLFVAVN